MTYTVYILKTSASTLYIGWTNNLAKRLLTHRKKNKSSSKYMRYFDFFDLVYQESWPTKEAAMKREWALKQLTKKKKEELISSYEKSVLKNK